MTELKAYSCMEIYSGEWTGAIIFAKSNIEARKSAANEFNDGELGGLQVNRAPWADKYGSRSKVPIADMVDHGWHFECAWSGITINSDTFHDGVEIYDHETKKYYWDEETKGKEPVGYQDGLAFACQEYADKWHEEKRLEKEFHEEELKRYRSLILKRLPDAILTDEEGYGRGQSITSYFMKTSCFHGSGPRYVLGLHIPIKFPGMKHWAALEYRQPDYKIGPTKPEFVCARGDFDVFQAWVDEQKEKYKL